jgi:signal transduction histidine kinase
MLFIAPPWWQAMHILAVVAALGVVASSLLMSPRYLDDPLDRVFLRLPVVWLLALAAVWLTVAGWLHISFTLLDMLAYHAICVTAAAFLLAVLKLEHTLFDKILIAYAAVGAGLLLSGHGLGALPENFKQTWVAMTAFTAVMVLVATLFKLKKDKSVQAGLAMVASLWGLALVAEDLLLQPTSQLHLRIGHGFYLGYLCLLWWMLTVRVHWLRLLPDAAHATPSVLNISTISSLNGFDSNMSGMQMQQEFAIAAVVEERRRIAQDIHDGVGAQLVGLLTSLNGDSPQHRRMMLALESCLLDLKTTVDNIDDDDGNIFDVLGRLRYRFQPSLTRSNIRMVWAVDVAGPLITLPKSSVLSVQRIVQECLANVLLHSQAKTVKVSCRYEAQPVPQMHLEVQDDGVGIVKAQEAAVVGKGLSGMRERALRMSAELHVGTKLGSGTRVRLTVPLERACATATATAYTKPAYPSAEQVSATLARGFQTSVYPPSPSAAGV